MTNWLVDEKYAQSKRFVIPNVKITEKLLVFSKRVLCTFTGLITGHCPSRYHLKNIGQIKNDIYRFCNMERETSEHLLCSCDALYKGRSKFPNSGFMQPGDIWTCLLLLPPQLLMAHKLDQGRSIHHEARRNSRLLRIEIPSLKPEKPKRHDREMLYDINVERRVYTGRVANEPKMVSQNVSTAAAKKIPSLYWHPYTCVKAAVKQNTRVSEQKKDAPRKSP